MVSIDITDLTGVRLSANTRFTYEIQTPVGAVLDLTRSIPAAIDTVMELH